MIHTSDIELVRTCGACPEQYDAFHNGKQVGYFRLRHGTFRVHYPDAMGACVYGAKPKGDGLFEEDERERFLHNGKVAIIRAMEGSFPLPDEDATQSEAEVERRETSIKRAFDLVFGPPPKWLVEISFERIRIHCWSHMGELHEMVWRKEEWHADPDLTLIIANAINLAHASPASFTTYYEQLKLAKKDRHGQ